MTLVALLVPDKLTSNDSDGIDGGAGCNYIISFLLWIFLAQIWHVAPLGPFNDHLRIRFLIWYIASPWWHVGGFSETTYMNGSKLYSTEAR